ncbi:hypothetical protein FB567DRAFT_131337 [Paraphoma chrysanthemicola]|uniref:Secreted protein n=1 Tax=Paraphoma chrysanthemicola TaxID=798071 RepID=A0A8K0R0J8_9PLEO|nr:hypothetical protein FB567DRAFT_131337 [Paraphoma chrysanthemicola]
MLPSFCPALARASMTLLCPEAICAQSPRNSQTARYPSQTCHHEPCTTHPEAQPLQRAAEPAVTRTCRRPTEDSPRAARPQSCDADRPASHHDLIAK